MGYAQQYKRRRRRIWLHRWLHLLLAHHLSPRLQRHRLGNGSPRPHHGPELRGRSGCGVGGYDERRASCVWGGWVGVVAGVVLWVGLVLASGQPVVCNVWGGSVCGVGGYECVQCVWGGYVLVGVGLVIMQCVRSRHVLASG